MRGLRKLSVPLRVAPLVLACASFMPVQQWALGQPAPAPIAAAAPGPDTQPTPAQPVTQPGAATATPPAVPGVLGPVEVRVPSSTRPVDAKIRLSFKDAPVDAVLNYFSDAAGLIVVKELRVEGRVNLVSEQPVSTDEAVTLLNTVLKSANPPMTAIRQGRTLKITSRDSAKKQDIPVRMGSDPKEIPETDELITQIVQVNHLDAVKLKTDLAPLIGTDADVSANASSNTFVITDTAANVHRVVNIIYSMDLKNPTVADLSMTHLTFADAANAAKLINTIFTPSEQTGQQSSAGGPGAIMAQMFRGFGGRRGGGGGGGGPGGGGGEANGPQEGPNLKITAVSDDRTNTVIVTGPTEGVKMAEEILKKLDSDQTSEQTFFIYPLKNGQSSKLAVVLNTLFGNSTSGTGSTGYQGQQSQQRSLSSSSSAFGGGGGGGGSSFGGGGGGGFGGGGGSGGGFGGSSGGGTGIGQRAGGSSGFNGGGGSNAGAQNRTANELTGQVFVVANDDTNSLLVTTATRYQDKVRKIITELDRPVPQVLIKVLIAEVTHDSSDDLGLDFSVLNQRKSGNGQTLLQNLGNAASNTANGGLALAITENNFTATLHALAAADKLDVLSRPYILTSDNQEATITVGSEEPFITNTRTTDTNATINTIQYQDIGIILDVTPHINPDGLVILDVSAENSQPSSGAGVTITQGVTAPVFLKRSAQSRVGIIDGQTIVIGGMMEDQKTETITKVPILGDLPGVGPFFQRRQDSKTKTELLIFLTPHVAQRQPALTPMTEDEVRGTRLLPNAVGPGTYNEYMRGMRRGGDGPGTTQPATQPGPGDPVVTVPWALPHRDAAPAAPAQDSGSGTVFIPIPVPVNTNDQQP